MSRDVIYLDANSTTPPDGRVWEKMRLVAEQAFANPGSSHQQGRRARQSLEESRGAIARILGGSPQELTFTSGATESINLALNGLSSGLSSGKQVLALTGGEHPAVAETAQRLRRSGWELVTVPLDQQGVIDRGKLIELPWEQIGLVSVIYAHNETGVVQDLSSLGELCAAHQIPWHVDFVQATGRIPVSFHELGATAASFCVHKCHGPRGIGGLFLRSGVPFVPSMTGGFQEGSRRPGTESVALAAGMAEALRIWENEQESIQTHLKSLRDHFETLLLEKIPTLKINSQAAKRLPNTSNITFPGLAGEALLVAFDLEGVCCSLGSACASGSVEPSPVLLAMGLDESTAKSSVRFSFHRQQRLSEVEEAVSRIVGVVSRLRSLGGE